MRIHSNGYWFRSLVQVSIPKFWCWRLHISETIWTTETSFAPLGSATIALGHSSNRTRISPTVSEIFDRKNSPEREYFFILILIIPSSAKSKVTYLLLEEWSDPENFDIISKLGIGRRQFLILAGKFQLVDSPWGEQVPHYKHRRRRITYLLREIPMKNRERWDRSQQTGKLSG